MILIDSGFGRYGPQWGVNELQPCGFCRVYYLLGGDITYREGDTTQKLDTGHLYIFPASRSYSISHTAADRIKCMWLHIDFLPTVVDSLLQIPVSPQSSLYFLLNAMIAQMQDAGKTDLYLHYLAEALVQYLQAKHLHSYPRRLEGIIAYLQAHCREELTVSQVSSRFGYSTEYFIRMFHQSVHLTPYQYLTGCRLHAAAQLLLQGHSVKETALLCGFRDAKTFGRCFRQRYLCAPSQYKSRYLSMP